MIIAILFCSILGLLAGIVALFFGAGIWGFLSIYSVVTFSLIALAIFVKLSADNRRERQPLEYRRPIGYYPVRPGRGQV